MPKQTKLEKKLLLNKKSCWEEWDKNKTKKAFEFCDGYKNFLNSAKTEREAVKAGEKIARENGFITIKELKKKKIKNNETIKIYKKNREKNLILAVFKKDFLKNGAKFIVSHIDSPRLDFKPNPLYESESLAFLKTQYYGGIKKYHWPTIQLSLRGTVMTKNNGKVKINIGDNDNDPIFMITDLLPHLARKQMGKPLREAIEGEELNLLVGSIPVKDADVKNKIKLAILDYLNKKYKIIEEDFFSADLQAVPCGKARDLGFDRSMIAAYGQDDKICAYTSLMSIIESNKININKTQICFLVDKEEVGSDGVSGSQSLFLENFLLELMEIFKKESSLKDVYQFFSNSEAISADVTAGFDPDYKQVYDAKNTAYLGYGVAIEKYTGSGGKYSTSEASAEYAFQIKEIFNKNNIKWQSGGLGRIDEGGGGTIAKYLANRNIDTIDCGIALFNMHAPMEISSKADIYSAYEAYKAFYKN
ncbi:MAG: aminopeptidase [Patescibacteria group bacterium]|nr:aminopeptidase [Patescibacteria group bacterium]